MLAVAQRAALTSDASGGARREGGAPSLFVDEADRDGIAPLHAGCARADAECVRLLLEARAAADPRDSSGATPLFLAAQRGDAGASRAW